MATSRVPFGRTEVLTWPNLVTLARLLAIPLFVWLLFGRHNRAAAAWLLGALGSTDWVDGWLARRLGRNVSFCIMKINFLFIWLLLTIYSSISHIYDLLQSVSNVSLRRKSIMLHYNNGFATIA